MDGEITFATVLNPGLATLAPDCHQTVNLTYLATKTDHQVGHTAEYQWCETNGSMNKIESQVSHHSDYGIRLKSESWHSCFISPRPVIRNNFAIMLGHSRVVLHCCGAN